MSIKYELIIYWSEEDQSFIVDVLELPGCISDGKTYEEALMNAKIVIQDWIETATELGRIQYSARWPEKTNSFGLYDICTATYLSGAGTGTEAIPRKNKLTRKDPLKVNSEYFGAGRSSILWRSFARHSGLGSSPRSRAGPSDSAARVAHAASFDC